MTTKYSNKEDCDIAHKGIADEFAEVHKKLDYITGKIDGMIVQKGFDWQTFGVIGAIVLAIWNMIK